MRKINDNKITDVDEFRVKGRSGHEENDLGKEEGDKLNQRFCPLSKNVAGQQLKQTLCLLAAGAVARRHQRDNNT